MGGDRLANAEIVRRLLDGRERGPKRDAILLNSAAALFVAGNARSLTEGWDFAAELIDSGRASAKLRQLIDASRELAPKSSPNIGATPECCDNNHI